MQEVILLGRLQKPKDSGIILWLYVELLEILQKMILLLKRSRDTDSLAVSRRTHIKAKHWRNV